jgi:hypothetical protein
VSAGESGEELDWIVRRLAESLRVLGEQRSLEEIYELRDAANARPEPPSSGWPAGEPVDSADWVAQIRAVEGLKERNPEEALTRLRRFTEDILMMPGQEGARRKAWLLWRVFETTRSGWGIRDGDQAQWDEIQETASEACVDTALEHARSMRENPDYLTDLNAMAQLLMGTAIGGRRGLLVAAELYETLAGHLAAGQGDFASQVFAAWENAAESLDRADLDDDEIQARAKKIRSMLAARYGQAFDLELQASGLEHPKTLSYLSSYLEYLRSTDQKAEALNVSRRVYRQAIEQYGDGTEAAARILGVVGGYTEATDTMEDDPG